MKATMRKGIIYLTAESRGEVAILSEIFNNLRVDENRSRLWMNSFGGKPVSLVFTPHSPPWKSILDRVRELPDWELKEVVKVAREELGRRREMEKAGGP
jgi:hypothetical protein